MADTLYNETALRVICDALAKGHTLPAASARAGIHRATLHRWRQEHADAAESVRVALAKGRAELEERALRTEDSKDPPKQALELLSRRYPKVWGRKDTLKVDATVRGAAPKSREEAEAQCAAMMAAFAKDDDA